MPRLSKHEWLLHLVSRLPEMESSENGCRETVFGLDFGFRTHVNANVPAAWWSHFPVAVCFSVLPFLSPFIVLPSQVP